MGSAGVGNSSAANGGSAIKMVSAHLHFNGE
jgi:hypothetical protein